MEHKARERTHSSLNRNLEAAPICTKNKKHHLHLLHQHSLLFGSEIHKSQVVLFLLHKQAGFYPTIQIEMVKDITERDATFANESNTKQKTVGSASS